MGSIRFPDYVRSGDRVICGQGAAEPITLLRGLLAQRHEIGTFDLFIGMAMTDTVTAEHCDVVRVSSFGGFGLNGRLGKEGLLNVLPIHLHDMPALLRSEALRSDVVLVQVSGPDKNGDYSLGLVSDYLLQAIERARIVVAEVNPHAPITFGDTRVSPQQIDVLTESAVPPVYVPGATPTAEDEALADNIAERIADGATIQIGIGSAPNAILSRLRGHKDLGFHSGTLTDAMADLMRSGVATGARKPIDPRVAVTGTLLGTQHLYDFANENSAISMRSVEYTHNHVVLSRIDSLVSINSAIEVDLTGQVNAEVAGSRHIGAIGGQASFVRAGSEAEHGFSVIALRSTARRGTVSRITTDLAAGVVTTSRSDVDLIATEYGVAELRGIGLAERARRLIKIAHPDFREELSRAAHDLV